MAPAARTEKDIRTKTLHQEALHHTAPGQALQHQDRHCSTNTAPGQALQQGTAAPGHCSTRDTVSRNEILALQITARSVSQHARAFSLGDLEESASARQFAILSGKKSHFPDRLSRYYLTNSSEKQLLSVIFDNGRGGVFPEMTSVSWPA